MQIEPFYFRNLAFFAAATASTNNNGGSVMDGTERTLAAVTSI